MDQSKKTMRHFYCRDVLWETFEQMANDFDCSIDYLINEAMRYYARSKNYQSAMATSGPLSPQAGGGMMGQPPGGAGGGPAYPPNGPAGPTGPGGYGMSPPSQQHMASPHLARRPTGPAGAPPPPPVGGPSRRPGPSQAPPPRATSPGGYPGAGAALAPQGGATLYLV
jgi:neural Wiskott-Aldrich syndrome protein